ncbi:sushi, von Willebrand factor type A, EGF and pentraxin domain-containing protein 1-like isoform X2 [Ruditapes philippinarum]|uniref:sushi, von Willebrand factor type A, EGF and pentraxin domain-containing protein 1-like isoform X2 n=1 Tax=Ruditapes philippinarum TaxID=129788 RepID=UPI00295AEFAC|nr:sushi, von Willebrand factor type A, EGF and pentraxin domain-containing protein 1-like isoform X2 [Ruditapes philippinarum]
MFLQVMKCELILLLVFETVFAVVNVKINNFELEYSVTYENWCKSDKDRFQFIIGISIEQCVAECGARVHCRSLIYRNQINGCELYLTSETEQSNLGECVHVKKDNIKVIKKPCQGRCKHGEVCESISSKSGKCKVKECINTTAPDNGKVLGNQREVGNKIRYICNPGYELKKDGMEPVAECLYNGQWSHITECVKTNYTLATWSPWITCSVSCNSGTQTRSKKCSFRKEGNGESSCDHSDVQIEEKQSCYVQPCPTHGKACSNHTDCKETEGVCIQGKCFCHQLFAYNNTVKNCTKVCQTMTDNYTKFERKKINDFNSGPITIYGILDECKAACTEDPICLSFEIWPEKDNKVGCTTGVVTYDMMKSADPTQIRDDKNADLYSKTCS